MAIIFPSQRCPLSDEGACQISRFDASALFNQSALCRPKQQMTDMLASLVFSLTLPLYSPEERRKLTIIYSLLILSPFYPIVHNTKHHYKFRLSIGIGQYDEEQGRARLGCAWELLLNEKRRILMS